MERRRRGLGQKQRGFQIRTNEVVPVDFRQVPHRCGIERRGVIHQNVQPAEHASGHLRESRELCQIQ